MRIETNKKWTVAALMAAIGETAPETVLVFGKTLKADVRGVCWCGCDGATGGRFVPGHDSKFHSLAKQVARGLVVMPEFVSDEAEADFMKWHDAEVPVHAARMAAKAVTDAAKTKAKADKVEKAGFAEMTATEIKPVAVVKSMEPVDKDSAKYKELLAMVTANDK